MPVRPKMWLGGSEADYEVFTNPNGGLHTRHLNTNRAIPHVVANTDDAPLSEELLNTGSQLSSSMPIPGLQVANLAIGVLNLGVSAYTAYRVHKMDKKIDGISALLSNSVTHLDALIRENALVLGNILENQADLANDIHALRVELREGVTSLHDALHNLEARSEAATLEEQMRLVFQYYETCFVEMKRGGHPSNADLRALIDKANHLIAMLDRRINALAVGDPAKLPFINARAFAVHLELEARTMLNEGVLSRETKIQQMRDVIQTEVLALIERTPLALLATQQHALVEQYLLLDRAIRGSVTLVEFPNGTIQPMLPPGYATWDDNLEPVRKLLQEESLVPTPSTLPLRSLAEHSAWREVKELPRGEVVAEISTEELKTRLGVSEKSQISSNNLRELMLNASKYREDTRNLTMREFEQAQNKKLITA